MRDGQFKSTRQFRAASLLLVFLLTNEQVCAGQFRPTNQQPGMGSFASPRLVGMERISAAMTPRSLVVPLKPEGLDDEEMMGMIEQRDLPRILPQAGMAGAQQIQLAHHVLNNCMNLVRERAMNHKAQFGSVGRLAIGARKFAENMVSSIRIFDKKSTETQGQSPQPASTGNKETENKESQTNNESSSVANGEGSEQGNSQGTFVVDVPKRRAPRANVDVQVLSQTQAHVRLSGDLNVSLLLNVQDSSFDLTYVEPIEGLAEGAQLVVQHQSRPNIGGSSSHLSMRIDF